MKKLLKWLGITMVLLTTAVAVFLIWAYRPYPPFEPLVYTPAPLAYWPTEGRQRSAPESQEMNSKTLLEMIAFYDAEAARDRELFIDVVAPARRQAQDDCLLTDDPTLG